MDTARRWFVTRLPVAMLAAPLGAQAQPAGKIPRIGVLLTNSHAAMATRIDAFRHGLDEHGYIEGRTIAVEYRYGDGKVDRLPALAAELAALNVDLIVTSGTAPTRAAQRTTSAIPIVMVVVGDPIAGGFTGSLARPDRNITGLTQVSPELGGKRLELLKEAFPKVTRVVALVDPAASARGVSGRLKRTRAAADVLGIALLVVEVRGPNPQLEDVFRAAMSERAGAVLVESGPTPELHTRRIVDLAAKARLPAMYGSRDFVDAGGLMSYAPSHHDLFRRAATYVDKIVKGSKPAELPIEQPTKFEFVINMKTAKALGLTIPPSLLLRADQVIE